MLYWTSWPLLGDTLPRHERNEFSQFKVEWDKKTAEVHKEKWPEKFLEKMRSVLEALPADKAAFSKFIFDEARPVLAGMNCIKLPPAQVTLAPKRCPLPSNRSLSRLCGFVMRITT